jgi:TolA-binding protein
MEPPKAGLTSLGERIAAALEAETQPEQQLRVARAQLLERVTGAQRRTPRGHTARLRYAAIAALALLAVAGAAVRSFYRPISFVTNTGKLGVGDVLEAVRGEPMRVEFSEGSKLLLHQGARARVLDTQPAGARVLLESGVTDVSIVHRAGRATHWRFEAGPFQVLVTGTRFELGWQPAAQSLSLTMKSGAVEVSGACLPAPRVVERGASLHVSCASAAPVPEAATSPVRDAPAAQPAPASAPTLPTHAPVRDAKAAPHDFEASCETAAKGELVAIANRERLAGHVARARTALLALRKRFPGSSEAGTAAFTLGRMAFDQQAEYGEAARWFAAYLAEQPNGPLMGDAAGRLLEAHEKQGDRAAARRDAANYLQRFPDGPYAKQARRIFAE